MTSVPIFNPANVPQVINGSLTVNGDETVTGDLTVDGSIIGGNITFSSISTGTINSSTINNSGNIRTSGSFSAGSYVQSYAPIATTATLDFYGDSITVGTGATTSSFRWSTLVSNALAKTENNQATSGYQVEDMVFAIYNNRTPGSNTIFIMIGTNDLLKTINIGSLQRILISGILYSILPSANIVNARSGSVTQTGTWTNNPAYNTSGLGLQTVAPYTNSSLSCSVTGRFVVVSITTSNSSSPSACTAWNFTIDGVAQNSNPLSFININVQTNVGSTTGPYLYIFDTGSSSTTSHTVLVSPTAIGGYNNNAFVDWFAGFSPNQTGTSKCLIVPPPMYDITAMGGSQTAYDSYIQMERDMVRYLQAQLQLPVYYVIDDSSRNQLGYTFDLLHPNNPGHNYIANRVLNVLSLGETNYLSN
jgi:lysophospholipase L1-like esterase